MPGHARPRGMTDVELRTWQAGVVVRHRDSRQSIRAGRRDGAHPSDRTGERVDVLKMIGPQAASDDAATRRHRFHQSWYRAAILGLPYGTGPSRGSTTPRGNMLTSEDGAAGRNFLSPAIAELAGARIAQGGTVEPFRCRHNMLSSQPMCFNLVGQMMLKPNLASALVAAATGREIAQVTGVRLEDDGGKLLKDATGMDASIRYETTDGAGGILAIETKLTEQFSPKVYALDSKPQYGAQTHREGSAFDPSKAHELTDSRWNQLWRNQMLAEAVAVVDGLNHAEQLVIFPVDAGKTSDLVGQYADLLARPSAVIPMTLTDVMRALDPHAGRDDREWLDAFTTRYVDLEASADIFTQWLQTAG